MKRERSKNRSRRSEVVALFVALLAMLCAACSSHQSGHGATTTPPQSPANLIGPSAGYLGGHQSIHTVASTVPKDGDKKPYGVVVVPETPPSGPLRQGDLLVDNDNAKSNVDGSGSSIMQITPAGKVRLFATIATSKNSCPGGIGLDTGLFVFRSGYVIVGSLPSAKGTAGTTGAGCLLLINPLGMVTTTISGVDIDGPWDLGGTTHGPNATVFVTNTLVALSGETLPPVSHGDVVRLTFQISASGVPSVVSRFVIATGFSEQASATALVTGPSGVVISKTTAYVANPLENDIVRIPHAMTRTTVASTSDVLAKGGYLSSPLGLALAPNGDILAANNGNGAVVEIEPNGREVTEFPLDTDQKQTPPGSGDLFGIAATNTGLYFVKDDTNTLGFLKIDQ